MQSRNARIGLKLFCVYLLLYGGFVGINSFSPCHDGKNTLCRSQSGYLVRHVAHYRRFCAGIGVWSRLRPPLTNNRRKRGGADQ